MLLLLHRRVASRRVSTSLSHTSSCCASSVNIFVVAPHLRLPRNASASLAVPLPSSSCLLSHMAATILLSSREVKKEGFFGWLKIKESARLVQERMAGIGGIQGPLPLFDGKQFDDWRIKMQKIFNKISNAGTAKEILGILMKTYGDGDRNAKVKLQALRRQFETLIMEKSETIVEYFDKDPNPKFDYVVAAIEETRRKEDIDIEELLHSLEAHELRLNERKQCQEQALQARSQWKGKKGFKKGGKGGKKGKDSQDQQGEESSESGKEKKSKNTDGEWKFDKRKVKCYNCQKLGHYAKECWKGERATHDWEKRLVYENAGSRAWEDQKKYMMKMENNCLSIFNQNGKVVVQAQLSQNKTFKVVMEAVNCHCFTATESEEEWLWHLRFGHLNFQDISMLSQKKIVIGLPKKSVEKLGVVYSDVCGPMQVETPGGNRYFLIFIDDWTRKCWVYLLKRKGEVLQQFQKFKKLVERQSEKKLKILRTDGGGEYISIDFKEYCEKEGITHEVTPPYTPQHNGATERKNRTILNMVKCMLKSKGLPSFSWGEAVMTTTYVLNLSPTKRLNGVTPEEAWTGVKPDVKHLKIFGSLYYKHVPEQLRKKLDDRGIPLILIGYHVTSGYKLYDPIICATSFSREVKVDEAREWQWELKKKEGPTIELESEPAVESEACRREESVRRSSRVTQLPTHLRDYDLAYASTISSEENFVHFALIVEAEPNGDSEISSFSGNAEQLDPTSIRCKVCLSEWRLEEEVYVVQPQGFEVKKHLDKVYRLKKALYGSSKLHGPGIKE
ncbi:uncharacterized protein LOC106766088 [Vigna radiata var. radiata]|uniref:Uncharacterized protein LOC106766088 n=1 Tax=Vigna radiata var. radiata TaxID=3916 RepID=A0A1S3UJW9_VIGRR|nr:uncharacterized protein LOC106766088 [Vigna radiata var. radiata]